MHTFCSPVILLSSVIATFKVTSASLETPKSALWTAQWVSNHCYFVHSSIYNMHKIRWKMYIILYRPESAQHSHTHTHMFARECAMHTGLHTHSTHAHICIPVHMPAYTRFCSLWSPKWVSNVTIVLRNGFLSVQRPKTDKLSEVAESTQDADETSIVKTSKIVRHFPQKKSVLADQNNTAPRLSRAILSAVCFKRKF